MPPYIRKFKSNIGKFQMNIEILKYWTENPKRELKVDMLFQSSRVKTEFSFPSDPIFEYPV